MITSPGAKLSRPISSMVHFMVWVMAPIMEGVYSVSAIISASLFRMTQQKSSPSLKMVE